MYTCGKSNLDLTIVPIIQNSFKQSYSWQTVSVKCDWACKMACGGGLVYIEDFRHPKPK